MPKLNERFGALTVVSANKGFCTCVCDCGNSVIVRFWKLTGATNHKPIDNCGCLKNKKSKHELYHVWTSMKDRCLNPSSGNYKHYGGRGIKVHPLWSMSFATFLKDMGTRPSSQHSLDRIDNNGDYTPKNCRWATSEEQANNRRVSRFIVFNGETKTLTQWAKKLGFSSSTLQTRLDRFNWTVERALTEPIHISKSKNH